MRQAGIVGAGGGGFPTYFKYKSPLPHLIVNAPRASPVTGGTSCCTKSTSRSSSSFSRP
jgi:Na+-translocating ferredoxin:NAD+ oxidoreductase RnfC subunit